MKVLKLSIAIIAIVVSVNSIAQDLSEKEFKILKKEMLTKAKSTDPTLLKKMFEDYPKLATVQSELDVANAKIKELNNVIVSNKKELKKGNDLIAKQNGELFLRQIELNKNVTKTESGLLYEVLVEGKGAKPLASNMVKVHYEGSFTDGKVFDSSIKRGKSIEFRLTQVIKGWTEGLQLMNKGAKYKFYIPYQLAYGERGQNTIPPYSVLIFDVELIDYK